MRQKQAVPVLDALFKWLDAQYDQVLPKSINGIEPFAWLRDVLTRIKEHPVNRIEELLPTDGYKLEV